MRRLALLVVIALLAAACTTGTSASTPDEATVPDGSQAVPETAPDTDSDEDEQSFAGTIAAPEFPTGLDWLNTDRPLSLAELHGKVVLLDFWTYGCINCIHVIPDLKRLEAEYADELVVIGVHSAKFDNESNTDNIRQIILRYGLEHPVVNDADFEVWRSFGAQAWPTLFVIDPAGNVSGYHAGEGVYEVIEPVIASLVNEFEAGGELDRTPLTTRLEREGLPETVLSFPGKVTVAGDRLYISDTNHHRIVEATTDGEVLNVFGSGIAGLADGPALDARFDQPQGTEIDGSVLYVADTGNHAIRAIDLESGDVSTVAGTGEQGRWPPTGGPAASTALHSPWDLELGGSTLYIAMAGTHQIWAYDLAGQAVAPYAGSGGEGTDNGPLASATLAQPSGVTLADDGRLYFADSESSSIRWAGTDEAVVDTIAGTDEGLFEFGDLDAVGTEARFQHPLGVVADGDTVWVADTYNSKVKRIDTRTGEVETRWGSEAGWRDGAEARFYEPGGIDLADGVLYVADTNNHAVRTIDLASGEVGTIVLRGIEVFLPDADDEGFAGTIVELDPVTVGAGPGSIVLHVDLPDGYKVNPDAPSRFDWSVDGAVVALAPDASGVRIDPSFPLSFDATFRTGEGIVTGDLSIVYCDAESEAICLIEQVRVVASIIVAGEAESSTLEFAHEIVLPEF